MECEKEDEEDLWEHRLRFTERLLQISLIGEFPLFLIHILHNLIEHKNRSKNINVFNHLWRQDVLNVVDIELEEALHEDTGHCPHIHRNCAQINVRITGNKMNTKKVDGVVSHMPRRRSLGSMLNDALFWPFSIAPKIGILP